MPWPRTTSGHVIDPYGGLRDLEARQLRHVSEAFAEDPVRILRVARFAARYAPLGFTVADETLALMRRMVDGGRSQRAGRRARLGRDRKGAGRTTARRVHQRVARLRRVEGGLPGARCAVRRAAAGEVAPGNRHRRASAAGVARGGETGRRRRGALRRADARSRQGRDTRRGPALTSRARRRRGRAGRAARHAAARAEPAARAGGDHRALPHPRASRPRVARGQPCSRRSRVATRCAGRNGSRTCCWPARRMRAVARAWRPATIHNGASLPRRASAPRPWCCRSEERQGLSGEQIGEELRRRRIAAIESLAQPPR